MSAVENGQTVSVHYVGTLSDGTQFDSSRRREKPLEVVVGSNQLLPGFEAALLGMTVGETKKFTLVSSEAYGDVFPEAFQKAARSQFPEGFEFAVGTIVHGTSETGEPIGARVHAVDEDDVTLNLNHPLAGKDLTFEIELMGIQ